MTLLSLMMSFSFLLKNSKSLDSMGMMNFFIDNSDSFVEYDNKRHIPISLKIKLSKLNHQRFRLVNPQKAYRKTDVVRNPFLPNKQLCFVANYGNKWVLVYNQGGRASTVHCILARIEKSKVIEVSDFFILQKVDNKASLIDALKNGKYSESNIWD